MDIIVEKNSPLRVVGEGNSFTLSRSESASQLDSGDTRLYMRIYSDNTDINLSFGQTVQGGAIVDWGDGSAKEWDPNSEEVMISHTYTKAGDYVITIRVESGTIELGYYERYVEYTWGEGAGIFYQRANCEANYASVIKNYACNSLYGVHIGTKVTALRYGAFAGCANIKFIHIPDNVATIEGMAFSYSGIQNIDLNTRVTSFGHATFAYCESLKSISLPKGIQAISPFMFGYCNSLMAINIPDSVKTIDQYAFYGCESLSAIKLSNSLQTIDIEAFNLCGLKFIKFPPNLQSIGYSALMSEDFGKRILDFTAFESIPLIDDGALGTETTINEIRVPIALYDDWIKATNWTSYAKKITNGYTPTECTSLSITADDVIGNKTNTIIHWKAITNGIISFDSSQVQGIELSGTEKSQSFEPNTSYTEEITRTVTFTYMGVEASAEFTHGIWVDRTYEIDLNNEWRLSESIPNPDSETLDGVYESFSNHNVSNGVATMMITILGYTEFGLYIRSFAESSYDYVIVSQPDKTIDKNTNTSDATLVKAHTKGKQNGGEDISSYQYVEFVDLDPGEHIITVLYRKDSSADNDDDRGYLLIVK